ncbi:MAG: D-hexose-6-phosphate mutarotase [Planctomycetales bacterium]|nr:D-hexose-6-phosphate mutarotase [Planctomycetales bacterium]
MSSIINDLNDRFAIGGVARFEAGQGGLIRLSIATDQATAAVYPHGAHVTHFQSSGDEPLLWMSEKSHFKTGQPIRGGVPVIFPWFGPRQDDPDAPAHGLVRTAEWSVTEVDRLDDGTVRVSLGISLDSFNIVYRVSVGRRLGLEMIVDNLSDTSASFEQALHTYLTVGDVRQIRVVGLEGATYIDKVDGMARKQQSAAPIRFAGETDSVYLDTEAIVRVEDPVLARTIVVQKSGSLSTVVWNPWTAKASRMADFGDDEWPGMVCIETANVADNSIDLAPGDSATMTATLEIES